jgi:hypothetical protein
MLREPLATFFATATLAAATGIPRWRNVVLAMVFVVGVAFTRSTLFVAVGACLVLWCLIVAVRAPTPRSAAYPRFHRVGTLIVTSVAVGLAGFYMAGGPSGNGGAVASASINSSRALSISNARAGHKTSSSSPATESTDFQSPLVSGIAHGGIATYASATVRFFASPRAWAFTTQPEDWYQPLYPAMWLWYLLVPVAIYGLWRIRRRLDAITLVALPILLMAAEYTLALNSGVRQRSGVEPLFALLIIAGWVSWAVTLRWASVVLVVLAPLASLDLRSPWPTVGLLLGAAALFLLSRRLVRRDVQLAHHRSLPTPTQVEAAPLAADVHVERV